MGDRLIMETSTVAVPTRDLAFAPQRRLDGMVVAALVITAVRLALVAHMVLGGALYQDDIRGLIWMDSMSFQASLLWNNGSHVVPGTHAILWLHAHFLGLTYWPAGAIIMTLVVLSSAATWWMLTSVIRSRSAILVAFAVASLTPLTFSATAWYAQALTIIPVQIATAVGVASLARFARTKRWIWAALVVLAYAVALAFAEKSVVLLSFFPVAYFVVIAPTTDLRTLVRRMIASLPVWLGMIAVSFMWITTYTSQGGMTGHVLPVSSVLRILRDNLWSGVLPALVGGPWEWRLKAKWYEDAPYYGIADPPFLVQLLGSTLVCVGFVVAVRLAPKMTARALALLGSYYLPCFLLVVLARGHQLAPQLGLDLRFWADAVPPIALALGVVAQGIAETVKRLEPDPARSRRRTGYAISVGFLAVLLSGSVVSSAAFADGWTRNPTQSYLANMTESAESVGEMTRIFDTDPPPNILSGQFGPQASTAFMFRYLTERNSGEMTNDMRILTSDGRLAKATLRPAARFVDDTGCLTAAKPVRPLGPLPNLTLTVTGEMPRAVTALIEVRHQGEWYAVTRQDGAALRTRFPLGRIGHRYAVKLPSGVEITALRFRPVHPSDGQLCLTAAVLGVPVVAAHSD